MILGVIGAGSMGSAIIRGYIASGADPGEIHVCGHHPEKLEKMSEELGFRIAASAADLTEKCDMVLLAVKPKDAESVLREISPVFKADQILISIAAGKTISFLSSDSSMVRRTRARITLGCG